jgi:hypothetical protein
LTTAAPILNAAIIFSSAATAPINATAATAALQKLVKRAEHADHVKENKAKRYI